MRIWHKNFISILPRKQLLGQIREITLILKDLNEKGKTNHLLINNVMSYSKKHLYTYCKLLEKEMHSRNYKLSKKTINKWYSLFSSKDKKIINYNYLFKNWHNKDYLKICYYNLFEKYLCGGISDKEMKKIQSKIKL